MPITKKLKFWWKQAAINKKFFAGLCLCEILGSALVILSAIPAAKAVDNLNILNFDKAIIFLAIFALLIIASFMLSHIGYKIYYVSCKQSIEKICKKIYTSVENFESGQNQISLEKVLETSINSTNTIHDFADQIAKMLSSALVLFITCFVVAKYSLWVMLIMLAVALLGFGIVCLLNFLAYKNNCQILDKKDKTSKKIVDRYVSAQFPRGVVYDTSKQNFMSSVQDVSKNYSKTGLIVGARKHIVNLFVNVLVLVVCYFIVTGRFFDITLTTFLIIFPYLIKLSASFINFFEFFYKLDQAHIASNRLASIITNGGQEQEIIADTKAFIGGNLKLENVQANNQNAKISNICLTLLPKGLCTICGSDEELELLLNVLTGEQEILSGTITADGINVLDKSKMLKSLVQVAYMSPKFYNESIAKSIDDNIKKVQKICKMLEIHNQISALPKKYKTNMINDSYLLDSYFLFVIGLARAIAREPKWIIIEGLPQDITKNQRQKITKIINIVSKRFGTVLLTSEKTQYRKNCNYILKNGQISIYQ